MELQLLVKSSKQEIENILKDKEYLLIQKSDINNPDINYRLKTIKVFISSNTNPFSNTEKIEKFIGVSLDTFSSYVVLSYIDSAGNSNNSNWHKVISIVNEFENPFILINSEEEHYVKDFANNCNEKFRKNYNK